MNLKLMELSHYQNKANETVRIDWANKNNIDIVLLGMIGELGSVASVFKKRQRDGDVYLGFKEDLEEELGDLLWYVVVTANRLRIKLSTETRHSKVNKNDIYKKIYQIQHNVNEIVKHDEIHNFLSKASCDNDNLIEELITSVISDIHEIAIFHGSDISSIAEQNLAKTHSFFGGDVDTNTPALQFDKGL